MFRFIGYSFYYDKFPWAGPVSYVVILAGQGYCDSISSNKRIYQRIGVVFGIDSALGREWETGGR
jgi:hypothetical protein